MIFYIRIKKDEIQGGETHNGTMIHSESGEDFKMNTHHVSLDSECCGNKTRKTKEEDTHDETERNEREV